MLKLLEAHFIVSRKDKERAFFFFSFLHVVAVCAGKSKERLHCCVGHYMRQVCVCDSHFKQKILSSWGYDGSFRWDSE